MAYRKTALAQPIVLARRALLRALLARQALAARQALPAHQPCRALPGRAVAGPRLAEPAV